VRGGRFVQAVGTWLLLGVVNALGLYRAVEKERTRAERKGRQLRTGTARVAVDALIAALAVGQSCVEGVRRLQTATAGVLYPPETVIPNPARRRLDHALRIARIHEGDARRLLARMRPNDRNYEKVEANASPNILHTQSMWAEHGRRHASGCSAPP
jgi:hypothetical protein